MLVSLFQSWEAIIQVTILMIWPPLKNEGVVSVVSNHILFKTQQRNTLVIINKWEMLQCLPKFLQLSGA